MRTILVVALSLMFGLSAAVGVSRFHRDRAVAYDVETVDVLVAAKDVPRFTAPAADLFRPQRFPKDLAPPGAVARVEDVADRLTDAALVKDEPLLESKLTPKGGGRGVASVIPTGMRLVTIQTPSVATGVAGLALPRNRVDVLFTRQTGRDDDPTGGGMTRTLVQNVEIVAVDQRVEAPSDNRVDLKELRSVTLLVTPEQAARIELAQTAGKLHLTLRNPLDRETATGSVTLSEIEGRKPAPAPAPVAAGPSEATRRVADELGRRFADLAAAVRDMKPVAVAAPTPPPPPPAPARIRTLRGGHPGLVTIE